MSRKSQHFTQHSDGRIDEIFSKAIAGLGMRLADEERNRRRGEIRLDGIPFAQRPRELRKPGSAYYAQRYLEGRSVLGMLVDLGLFETSDDVIRRDSPDIEAKFMDKPSLYVEHTMVQDEAATKFGVAVDDANIAADEMAIRDEAMRSLFSGGVLHIRLGHPTDDILERGISSDALAKEIVEVGQGIHGPALLEVSDSERCPLFTEMGAWVAYKPGPAQISRPIQLPIYHARRELLEPNLHAALLDKCEKAKGYDTNCRPLWLLVDIDKDFDASDNRVRALSERAVTDLGMEIFDCVVVQQLGRPPMVLDPNEMYRVEFSVSP